MQKVQAMFIVSLIFAIIITVFALTNANPVVINLIFYQFEASQALVIFISAALGAVIVTSLGLVNYIKLNSQIKTFRKANDELTAKINSLTVELESAQIKKDETEAVDSSN